jgi:hypothetical protein
MVYPAARERAMRDDLLSTAEAARHCHLSGRTLEKRRLIGGGPPYHKVGRLVFYSIRDLDEWIAGGRRL